MKNIALAEKVYGNDTVEYIRNQADRLYEMARILDVLAFVKEMHAAKGGENDETIDFEQYSQRR